MRLIILILVVCITSCGKRLEPSQFESYIQSFMSEGLTRGVRIPRHIFPPMTFGPAPNYVLGYCRTGPSGHKIVINQHYWNDMSSECKELLIFHELGHCILNQGHDQKETAIMFSYQDTTSCKFYKYHRAEMLDELFQ